MSSIMDLPTGLCPIYFIKVKVRPYVKLSFGNIMDIGPLAAFGENSLHFKILR
jgi:hypothetical protein